MGARRQTYSDDEEPDRRPPPARTSERRENQLISLADKLAERQLRDGTASSQVITHYLKLGSTREKLEQERMRGEVELNKAKIEGLRSAANIEELYKEAIKAMRSYGGKPPPEEFDYDERD